MKRFNRSEKINIGEVAQNIFDRKTAGMTEEQKKQYEKEMIQTITEMIHTKEENLYNSSLPKEKDIFSQYEDLGPKEEIHKTR